MIYWGLGLYLGALVHDAVSSRNGWKSTNLTQPFSLPLLQYPRGNNLVRVVHTSAPHASARLHQRRPQPRILRQRRMRLQIGARPSLRQSPRPSSAPNSPSHRPPDAPNPSAFSRSITISIRSPSRTFPIGPPASASGETCPMHAPVETPLNRASVSTATCLQCGKCFSADVTW